MEDATISELLPSAIALIGLLIAIMPEPMMYEQLFVCKEIWVTELFCRCVTTTRQGYPSQIEHIPKSLGQNCIHTYLSKVSVFLYMSLFAYSLPPVLKYRHEENNSKICNNRWKRPNSPQFSRHSTLFNHERWDLSERGLWLYFFHIKGFFGNTS